MKTIKSFLTVLSLFLVCSFAHAQGGCQGDNIKVYKGASGCGCHCMKECISPSDLPLYLANGWSTEPCWNCCKFKNWVDAEIRKTSLDAIVPNVEPGSITIAYTLATEGDVKIQVTDMTGRTVATVADEYRQDLDNELIWNNSALSPGLYYLTLETGDHRETKMISVL
ncbi:MAG TPA: T9SS type A sorting domain-containing protein [Saprospiraceae bacterium]|nr:T9SS type A sorting domain-containing protein [Saprospiraceae bacterium]